MWQPRPVTNTGRSLSVVRRSGARYDVDLATYGGTVAGSSVQHPFFFDGFVNYPEQTAHGLLLVARVARTRFYTPPNMVRARIRAADPVVSHDGSVLRFESFSPCCGVYARLDLRAGSLDAAVALRGTTNVDFNEDMRGLLAQVGPSDPLHLNVGEALTASTLSGTATEERVPLPDRWIKGFAEAQILGAQMKQQMVVSPTAARRFLRTLPATSTPYGPGFGVVAASGAGGLRLTSATGDTTVRLGGPERLRILEPMVRFAGALRISGAGGYSAAASQWQLDLTEAHLTLILSPSAARGFSGEGAALDALLDNDAEKDATRVLGCLATRNDPSEIASSLRMPVERVRAALDSLGAAGLVGYDSGAGAYFRRELPVRPVEELHPRLAGARRLVDRGAVTLRPGGGDVVSGPATYYVRDGGRSTCTCLWFAQHGLERGSCKHLLAVRIARKQS